jgi:CubicO group peptidase (beta-lactamase class C family)
MRTSCLLLQASVFFHSTAAKPRSQNSCPLLGPAFPYPQDLPSSDAFRKATTSLDAALDAAVKTGSLPYGDGPYNKTAFSVTLFNGETAGLLYEYHYTPSFISESKIGARKIDADSVYRIASVSKALTAYLLLICDGEAHLNTAVADILPELARTSYNSTLGILIDWSQVTVADLMSQLSPLGYNCKCWKLESNHPVCRMTTEHPQMARMKCHQVISRAQLSHTYLTVRSFHVTTLHLITPILAVQESVRMHRLID